MRAQPRKPEWLAQTPPQSHTNVATSIPAGAGPLADTTARVLDFPASARRPATAAAAADVGRPVLRPTTAAGLPATPYGGTLSLEPAYKTALARITNQAAAAADGAGQRSVAQVMPATAALGAAARPPSARLDELLAARPPQSRLGPLAAAPNLAQAHAVPSLALQRQQGAPPASTADAGRLAPDRLPAAASAGLSTDVEERLRQRTELARVQIRNQLSPLFSLSQALLGAEEIPGRAAVAQEAAGGLGVFERLAARPASSGSGAVAPAAGTLGAVGPSGRQALSEPEQHSQQQGMVNEGPAAGTEAGGAGGSSQQPASEAAGGAQADASLPLAQDPGTAPDEAAPGHLPSTLPPAGAAEELGTADVQAVVAGLRRQAEVHIRAECERLAASMLSLFHGMLDSLAQAHQRQPEQQADSSQAQAAAQKAAAGGSAGPDTAAADSQGEETRLQCADGAAAPGAAESAEPAMEAMPLEAVGSSTLPPDTLAASQPPVAAAAAQPPAPRQPDESCERQEGGEEAAAQQPELQLAWSGPATVVVGAEAGEEQEGEEGSVGLPLAPAQSPQRGQASLEHRQASAVAGFERLVVEGPWGAGFGSPIRLAPGQPSPPRQTASASPASRAEARGAAAGFAGAGAASAGRGQPSQEAGGGGAAPKSLSFEPSPAAAEAATPALQLRISRSGGAAAGAGLGGPQPAQGSGGFFTARSEAAQGGYFTARSHGVGASAEATPLERSGSSWPAASGPYSPLVSPGGALSEAGSGAASSRAEAGPRREGDRQRQAASIAAARDSRGAAGGAHPGSMLASGARDLSAVSASIRRMAAEMRLKHGVLAAAPLLGGSRPHTADSAQQQQQRLLDDDGALPTSVGVFRSPHSLLGLGPRSARRPSSSGGATGTLYPKSLR